MKPNNFFIILGRFCLIVLTLFSLNCGKDSTTTTTLLPPPPPPPPTCPSCQLLYYGGDQVGAPGLDAGTYEAAARFTPTKIGDLKGKTIKEIHYFVLDKPESIKIKLYGPLNATTPGNLLYSADVTSATERTRWNVHILTQDLILKDEDIWLSIEFKLRSRNQPIGGDAGPALTDGDWLFNSSDGLWTPIRYICGCDNMNWTIRLSVL
jgi:hypothetical protein